MQFDTLFKSISIEQIVDNLYNLYNMQNIDIENNVILTGLHYSAYIVTGLFILEKIYDSIWNFFFGYQHLLEFPKKFNFDKTYLIKNREKICKEPLVIALDTFCKENGIYKNTSAIVSLSGGVDSMVLLACLLHLRDANNKSFDIYTASIDYCLRKESNSESNFLKKYTKTMGVKSSLASVAGLSRKTENSGSRTEFEEGSRTLRFDTYKNIMKRNCLSSYTGVFVGHHQDDIIENIFTNSMRGANIMDLEVMRTTSVINGVAIFRPFLEFKKSVIYDFAHKYNVPYFLDTTPEWSNRGKMRNEIFPLLDSVFTESWRDNLKYLGTQSNEWGNYIDNYIVVPWIKEIEINNMGEKPHIKIPVKDQPKMIYSNVIMNSLHTLGEKMIKRTSMDKIMELIKHTTPKSIELDGHRVAVFSPDKGYIVIFNREKSKYR
jgi:tRNA(Ile)-lysidine synthetase-like protein